MQARWKDTARATFAPLVGALVRLGVSANLVTALGLALGLAAGTLAAAGRLRLAATCLILSALCDLLDGQVARRGGRAGPAGAFLDSCLDRLVEGAVFLGLILHLGPRSAGLALVAGAALIGAYMVSYARARLEGLGCECRVGLMERPERLIVLIIALFAGGAILAGGLILLAVLSNVTFVQRLRYGVRVAAGTSPASDPSAGR